MLLITKGAKKRDKKYTIVKQPLSIDPDKLKVTELDEHQNSLLMVYLNEFGSAVDSFLLSSSSRESHLSFLNSISTAQVCHIEIFTLYLHYLHFLFTDSLSAFYLHTVTNS